jgi:hypothetical protein
MHAAWQLQTLPLVEFLYWPAGQMRAFAGKPLLCTAVLPLSCNTRVICPPRSP